MPETIDAGPITLRRWTVDRADDLNQAIRESLPQLMSFMPWATTDHDMVDTMDYLERSNLEWDDGENFNYAILTAEGDVVGSCGLMSRQGPGVLEIGYWIHSAHSGQGFATAATSALAEAGLARPGIGRVEIHHDVDNTASGRVAAKAGFQELGQTPAERQAPRDSGTHLVWVIRR
ncbi:MAG: GNAT family N-acetyltransferase [Dermatophilaceae bacterium]